MAGTKKRRDTMSGLSGWRLDANRPVRQETDERGDEVDLGDALQLR